MANKSYENARIGRTTNPREREVAERFLSDSGDDSFTALFLVFAPQLIAFFRRRGFETGIAEDVTQEVMLIVYRRAGQIRDHKLFRPWLFKVARHAACRHYAQCTRRVQTVDLAAMPELISAPGYDVRGYVSEFDDWMKFLEPQEREAMTLRFVEEWEYHEIAAAKGIPIGTVQWRVFNSKKKLAMILSPRREIGTRAA